MCMKDKKSYILYLLLIFFSVFIVYVPDNDQRLYAGIFDARG